MGIFDYVDYEGECPVCGHVVGGWQTKDGDVSLKTVKPHEVERFYSDCAACGSWIEARHKSGMFRDKIVLYVNPLSTSMTISVLVGALKDYIEEHPDGCGDSEHWNGVFTKAIRRAGIWHSSKSKGAVWW